MSSHIPIAPELMAPAGDWDCARAAVENGADAVYFGLQGGFNARARAANFSDAELPQLMTFLRTRGVKGYLTLNTLVFDEELAEVERTVRAAVAAGVDAVLVQDLGALRLMHRLCPDLPLHASTQMTLSSAECIREVVSLGVRRVVLPRELSIAEIASIRRHTDVELEVFVHGALCISYSGQCLASLSLGGRSGNRGQCAQPCRLPYEVLCDDGLPDGERGDQKYPLSPHDLAAYDRLSQLIAAGVSALKIEGRMKPAEYVACVTRHYRTAIDAACDVAVPAASSEPMQASRLHHELGAEEVAEMELAFSRGFCHGWLDGPDHQALVTGTSSAKRGTRLGTVKAIRGERVVVQLAGPLRRGDGVVLEGDRSQADEQGGRVYEIFQNRRSVEDSAAGQVVELAFRYGSLDPARIRPGQTVWKTDDPQAARRLRKTYAGGGRQRCVALDLAIDAAVGSPLRITASAATGAACRLESLEPLAAAAKHPLSVEMLREQFGRLGKTPYELRRLEARIEGQPMIPLSVLGKLRHEMLRLLELAAAEPPRRTILAESAVAALRMEGLTESAVMDSLAADGTSARASAGHTSGHSPEQIPASTGTIAVDRAAGPHPNPLPKGEGTGEHPNPLPKDEGTGEQRAHQRLLHECHLHVLCRSREQIEAALTCGVSSVIVDLPDLRYAGEAVQVVRAGGAKVLLATPRIHKPREFGAFELLARSEPDGVLVRNLAGLAFFHRRGIMAVTDFSLHAANFLTAAWLRGQGAQRVTAAYDLDRRRLLDLAATVPPDWLEVVVHRHTPMFHTEYCLFCGTLGQGTGRGDCGRPCRRHTLRLRDRLGIEHLLLADSQCRITLFHAEAEDLSDAVPALCQRGVQNFRLELLAENTAEQVRRVLAAYQSLLGTS